MDKATKQFIIQQRKEMLFLIDKRFEKIDKRFEISDENTDSRIKKVVRALTKRIDDQAEESRRYMGALKESWDSKFEAVIEMLRSISERNEKIDIMFEHMGKQEVDISITKEAARNHEQRIKNLEIRV